MSRREDDALGALVGEYLDRLQDGERLEPEEILLAHPELGPRILEEVRAFIDLAADSSAASDDNEPLGVLGDYTLRRQLGRGGMGVVYEAWQGSMDRAVALKVLPAGVAADDRAVTRFIQEARLAGKLSHPNVVGVHGMGVTEQTPYYAMELVEGETLAQILSKTRDAEPEANTPFGRKDSVVYFGTLAEAFAEVADGLQHAHSKGVTHRDIKPSNLIRAQDGCLRILDFGLARLEGQGSLTNSGDVVGTPLYMSPEQARRKKIPVDHRTDVYSLGATIYEALCGRPPFRGKDHADTLSQIVERDPIEPQKLNPRVPRDIETIVLKCLRKDASERYGTAEALGQDLRRHLRGDPIEARPRTRLETLARRVRRHRRPAFVGATVLVLVLATSFFAFRFATERAKTRTRDYERRVVANALRLMRGETVRDHKGSDSTGELLAPWNRYRGFLRERVTASLETAIRELEQLSDLVPDRFEAHYQVARGRALLGDASAAIEAVTEALRKRPDFVPALVLERRLRGVENPETLEIADTSATSAWLEARSAEREKRWKHAVAAWTRLIELEEAHGEIYLGSSIFHLLACGAAHLSTESHELARRDFAIAGRLARDHGIELLEPDLFLAKAYLLEERHDDADEICERLHARSSHQDEAALWIAVLHTQHADDAGVLEWITRIEDEILKARLEVRIRLQRGETRAAIQAGRLARRAMPDDGALSTELGFALLRDLWERGEWREPGEPAPSDDRAFREVVAIAADALRQTPGSFRTHAFISQLHRARGDLDRAREASRRSTELFTSRGRKTGRRPREGGTDVSQQGSRSPTVAGLAGLTTLILTTAAPSQDGSFVECRRLSGTAVNTPLVEFGPSMTDDGRLLYFARSPDRVNFGIYEASRAHRDASFGDVRRLTELDALSPGCVGNPLISGDGLTLWFNAGGALYRGTRSALSSPEGDALPFRPERIEELDGDGLEVHAAVTADGRTLVFQRAEGACFGQGVGTRDLFEAWRSDDNGPWFERSIDEINLAGVDDMAASLSSDGLTIFWGGVTAATRDGTNDLWMASRPERFGPDGRPRLFGDLRKVPGCVMTGAPELNGWVSSDWPADGSTMLFTRFDAGSPDFFQATWRMPETRFRRGDANSDTAVGLSDAVSILQWLFSGGPAPECEKTADVNDREGINISDAIHLLEWLFSGGPPPSAPTPGCGTDPTPDDGLSCHAYTTCRA